MMTTSKPELKSVAMPVRIPPNASERYQNTTLATIDAIKNGGSCSSLTTARPMPSARNTTISAILSGASMLAVTVEICLSTGPPATYSAHPCRCSRQ